MPRYLLDDGALKKRADRLIEDHRPLLKNVIVNYLFRPEAPVANGKTIAGMCIKVDDRNRTIHEHDFIIEISKDVWDSIEEEAWRDALMDHELAHAGLRLDEDGNILRDEETGRIKTYIIPHDIEEFEDVLERHGAYHGALRKFLEAHTKHKLAKKAETEE
jgi:Fe-S cluster biosynthesis and repair protein YggX